jgi:hypothetical protein
MKQHEMIEQSSSLARAITEAIDEAWSIEDEAARALVRSFVCRVERLLSSGNLHPAGAMALVGRLFQLELAEIELDKLEQTLHGVVLPNSDYADGFIAGLRTARRLVYGCACGPDADCTDLECNTSAGR